MGQDYYKIETHDFKIKKGDTANLKFLLKDPDGNNLDVTSYGATFNVYDPYDNANITNLTKTHNDGVTNGDGIYYSTDSEKPSGLTIDATNKFVVTLSYFDTAELGEDVYPFDVEFTKDDGGKFTIEGNLIVSREVTVSVP